MSWSLGSRARPNAVQFAKFVAVGLLNTAFAYGLYAALLYLGLGYAMANGTALVIGIAIGFRTQGTLVFGNRETGRLWRFVLAWGLIYLVNVFLISRFVAMGFDAYVAGALTLPCTTVLSFVAQKFFVFRTQPGEADAALRRNADV